MQTASTPKIFGKTGSLSLDAVYIGALLILVGLRPLLTPLPPYDFWWHLATGRIIATTGAIPTADGFSFTQAGAPFFNQSWLAQLLMYGLYQLGGVELIVLAQSLLLAAVFGGLLLLCVRISERPRMSVGLLALIMLLTFDNWTVRPQSYAFACFIGFLLALYAYRGDETRARALWALPPLMALWVNLHGSFVLGGALIAITAACEALKRMAGQPALSWAAWRRLVLWGALTAAAMLLNPRGPGVLSYVGNLVGSSQVTDLVTEWAPPNIRELSGAIFYLFVIFTFLVLIYARRRPDLTDLALLLAFLWLALGAGRNVVWFGFVAAPLLAAQLATLMPARRSSFAGSPALNGLLLGMLLLLYASALPWLKPWLYPPSVGALLAEETPTAVVEALRREPPAARPQRLFNEMGYGSYLIWALPEQKVFIDPRIELYPREQWDDFLALSAGQQVEELIEKYRLDGMLLRLEVQRPLADAVQRLPGWELRYADEQSVYLVRR